MPGKQKLVLSVVCMLGWLASLAGPAGACSVPVFRYALERWPADPYRVVVFHRGALTAADKKTVEGLRQAAGDGMGSGANLLVRTVDLTEKVPPSMQALWDKHKSDALPHMVVLYPPWTVNAPCWTGRLTDPIVKTLTDSPVRKELAKRILQGDSAVWILLECGNKKQDDAAAALLSGQLGKLAKAMKVPEQAEQDTGGYPGGGGMDLPELRVAFSVVRLSRKAPAEQMLVKMLLGSEEDLADLEGPMAFPVFGRGRALYALVNKGINEDNIIAACEFLVGPCSCQVKQQNPGLDLLISAEWEKRAGGEMVVPKTLPPLKGIGELIAPKTPADDPKTNGPTTRPAGEERNTP